MVTGVTEQSTRQEHGLRFYTCVNVGMEAGVAATESVKVF